MAKTRKYWVGWSNENDNRPTDWETYIVCTEDELLDAQHDGALAMADDYLTEGEDDE